MIQVKNKLCAYCNNDYETKMARAEPGPFGFESMDQNRLK